jgi:hypothetical protein
MWQYREAPRTKDLRQARNSAHGSCTNGNHRTEIDEPLWPQAGYPDMQRCQGCALWLLCNTAGEPKPPSELFGSPHVDISLEQEIAKYPCLRFTKRIRFYYHGTCCIELDVRNRKITDHHKYGYSVTTSRAIRWYLEALNDEGYLASRTQVDTLIKAFKKGVGVTWFDI